MNIKEIKEVISLMNENNLVEIEIEKDGTKIRLKKTMSQQEGFAPTQVVIQREKTADTPLKEQIQPAEKVSTKNVEIKAPMVGTFYRAPSPDSPPYVDVGQIIEPGQIICIIEAMKLMNEIKAEIKGKIVQIVVENAEPVEFGQSLFIIEPL